MELPSAIDARIDGQNGKRCTVFIAVRRRARGDGQRRVDAAAAAPREQTSVRATFLNGAAGCQINRANDSG